MEDLCERVERAALLHDVGKLVLRANPDGRNHSEAGAEFLARFFGAEDKDLLRAVRHHHAADLKHLHASEDFSFIVYEADNLAAGSDRRALENATGGFSAGANLESVFNLFGGDAKGGAREAFYLRGLDEPEGAMQFPQAADRIRASVSEYQILYQHLEANFQRRSPAKMSLNELLRILEATMSYVPSSTNRAEAADISLYDHMRLTAAYAAALYRYFKANGISDYQSHTTGDGGRALRGQEVFLLVSGDLSGIQSFIYAIPSAGAMKSLRGRSFYLEILLENVVDEILCACGISRSALLYTGGGHFYLLLANTEETKEVLARCREEINDRLLRLFGGALYLATAWTPCAAAEFLPQAEGGEASAGMSGARRSGTQEVFRRVSEGLAQEKLCRYSPAQLGAMFSPESAYNRLRDSSRECGICHSSTADLIPYPGEEGAEACPMCAHLYTFGKSILDKDVFCVSEEKRSDALPLPGIGRELYLSAETMEGAATVACERIYIKNKVYTGERLMTHLWLGDYAFRDAKNRVSELEELAAMSGGGKEERAIPRLGVLRADVDHLGAAFLAGFPAQYATLTRTAALSRQLSLFFKKYMNSLCGGQLNGVGEKGEEKFSLFDRRKEERRAAHIVYSGGDDLFLIGAWDEIVEFAVDLRRAFRRFTGGKLRFSAGIGIFKPKCPVAEMARRTGDLESLAKAHPGKDAVALFGVTVAGRSFEERTERAQVYG
ncbi:MAG: type III-A CRISPR-associated protein Cas10/Csm1, partial [Oscillospiraceae bacterium]|nr:type III-A CRISPR-associated protein Cas10/Csm1 [Oscillospiraceae bacterium]